MQGNFKTSGLILMFPYIAFFDRGKPRGIKPDGHNEPANLIGKALSPRREIFPLPL